jgi:hypothetical protein
MPRIYLDLDGVMADFDAHFPALFKQDHRELPDAAMWGYINNHPTYFLDMPMCPGALDFWKKIENLHPIILTACPKTNYERAAKQKRQWVYKHLGRVTTLPVLGGKNKALFMHSPGDVLIDDFRSNIKAWEKNDGVGILHRDFGQTRDRLAQVLEGRTLHDVA